MIEFTATTHPGNRYQHNEDAIGWNEDAGLWFVADGIGGHARGDLASATVKQALLDASKQPEQALTELVMLAHRAVLKEGLSQNLTNMGSTLVLARIKGSQLNIAWCGDSRAYLWRSGELKRLTRDHSLLEQLLESGVVAPEEAFGHPRRNVLVQALGIDEPPPVPSEMSLTLDNQDVVLLCSDGVHDELHDDTLAEALTAMSLAKPLSTQNIVDELERRVLATDARDNLSLICLYASNLEPRAGGHTAKRPESITQQRFIDTQKLPLSSEQQTASQEPAVISIASNLSQNRQVRESFFKRIAKPLAAVLVAFLLAGLGWLLTH